MNQSQGSFGCLVVTSLVIGTSIMAFAAAVKYFFPAALPLDIFFVWHLHGTAIQWLLAVIPLLFMSLFVNVLTGVSFELKGSMENTWRFAIEQMKKPAHERTQFTPFQYLEHDSDEEIGLQDVSRQVARVDPIFFIVVGIKTGILGGIFEELIFRWWMFLLIAPLAYGFDLLSCGSLSWVYLHLIAPIMNVLSLGLLHDYLYFDGGWQVGFVIFWSALSFKADHGYQNWLGRVNAWFFGLYTIGLTFAYGLPIAMVGHFLFNVLAGLYMASTASSERMRKMAEEREKQESLQAADDPSAQPVIAADYDQYYTSPDTDDESE